MCVVGLCGAPTWGAPNAWCRSFVLGSVAASGLAVRGDIGSTPELTPNLGEPQVGSVIAVPLRRPPHVFGVIALFAPAGDEPFDAAAEASLLALAGPASTAIENVLLHDEATRASWILA